MEKSGITIRYILTQRGGNIEELCDYAKKKGVLLAKNDNYVLSQEELKVLDPLLANKINNNIIEQPKEPATFSEPVLEPAPKKMDVFSLARPALKTIGHINLDELNQSTKPKRKRQEERRRECDQKKWKQKEKEQKTQKTQKEQKKIENKSEATKADNFLKTEYTRLADTKVIPRIDLDATKSKRDKSDGSSASDSEGGKEKRKRIKASAYSGSDKSTASFGEKERSPLLANKKNNKKIYEAQLFDNLKQKSDKDILNYLFDFWKINEMPNQDGAFKVVASYRHKGKDENSYDYGCFVDIRNLDGDILYYPFRLGQINISVPHNENYTKEALWLINVKLAPEKYREKNPFSLTIANNRMEMPSKNLKDRLAREAQIRKIFKDTGYTERDAKNTVHALHNIMDDLYSNADERFIFELLQNADDQPEKGKTVSVILQLLKNHILFMHDGRVFDTNDVDSICSIGDSTKRNDKEKIGYKGIGFKSVFTGSDTVIINSGNYSFAFDRFSPIYGDEDTSNIPWQLKPIWQEKYRYPKEIRENDTFWKQRVGISLKIEEDDLKKYRMSIAKIFSHPIFLLFLKNIDKIDFIDGELHTNISKTNDEEILRIERDGVVDSSWIVKDYIITIPPEIREALQDDRNVPEKLKESTFTQISFAAKVEDGEITKMKNSVLYAYLPTSVNDFNFPFIVNADFLLAANREQLHVKKIWNQFLFSEIGKLTVAWVASLSRVTPSYLELLPIGKLNEEETGALSLSTFFNKSFIDALGSAAFILSDKDELAKQNEIIIDKTGLSEIVGADLFCQLLGTEKCLPSKKIDSKILEENIFENIEFLKFDDVICAITNNTDFNKWYLSASEEQKKALYKWIEDNNTRTHEDKLRLFVSYLPLFQFGEDYKSLKQIESSNCIITTKHIVPVKEILSKLNLICSDNVFGKKHPLYEYIELPDNKVFFKLVKDRDSSILEADERKRLFFALLNISDNYRDTISITDEQFVTNVLDYFYDNEINVLGKYIQYFSNQKIIGRFINSDDYTLESERLSNTIRQWANNEEKEKFLIALGVKDNLSDEIIMRKSFLNNEPISLSYTNNISNEITAFLNWCITLTPPFTKENQVKILKKMFSRLKIDTEFNDSDYSNENEWDNERYKKNIRRKLHVYCMKGKLPKRGVYNNVHLFTENVEDYAIIRKKYNNRLYLYINIEVNKNIEDIVCDLYEKGELTLSLADMVDLLMVPGEIHDKEIADKEEAIKNLSEENHKKDEIIEGLRVKLQQFEKDKIGGGSTASVSGTGNTSLSKLSQYEAQIEAQKRLMQEHPGWGFPQGYGEWDDNREPYHFSTIKVKNEKNGELAIVLKSYKNRKEPFKINPEEWDWIQNGAKLLIYDGKNIVPHKKEDLIKNQSNISITFSTDNLDIDDKISEFSKILHYFKELHFDFDSFNISDMRNMHNTIDEKQDSISDVEGL